VPELLKRFNEYTGVGPIAAISWKFSRSKGVRQNKSLKVFSMNVLFVPWKLLLIGFGPEGVGAPFAHAVKAER